MFEESAVLTSAVTDTRPVHTAVRVLLPTGLQALVVTPSFAGTSQLHPPLTETGKTLLTHLLITFDL